MSEAETRARRKIREAIEASRRDRAVVRGPRSATTHSDAELVGELHRALDRASDLAISLGRLVPELQAAAREVATALVAIMDRAAENSHSGPEEGEDG